MPPLMANKEVVRMMVDEAMITLKREFAEFTDNMTREDALKLLTDKKMVKAYERFNQLVNIDMYNRIVLLIKEESSCGKRQ